MLSVQQLRDIEKKAADERAIVDQRQGSVASEELGLHKAKMEEVGAV